MEQLRCRPGRAGPETGLRNSSIAGLLSVAVSAGALGSPDLSLRAVGAASPPAVAYLSLSFPSKNQGFVAAGRGPAYLILATGNGGRSWKHFKLGFGIDSPDVSATDPGASMGAIEFVDGSTGWVAGYSFTQCVTGQPQDQLTCPDALYVTHNGGKSWSAQIALGQTGNVDGFQFVNRQTGWALTSRCHVSKGRSAVQRDVGSTDCGYQQVVRGTSDGGKRWSRRKWKISNIAIFHFRDPRHGWAITRPPSGSLSCYSKVYVTATGGQKWTRVLNLPTQCQSLGAYADLKHGWVLSADATTCGTGGCSTTQLRQTQDSGRTWSVEQGIGAASWVGMSGFPQQVGFPDSKHGWISFRLGTSLETAGGIAMTANGGLTWTRSLPCYGVEPGATAINGLGSAWLAGSWVSYCSKPKGSGLFHSRNWGKSWQQVWPKL